MRDEAGRGRARAAAVLLEPDDLGAGAQRLADEDRTREHEAAVEEVAAHALRRPRGLPDRDVADEVGMRERRVVARHLAAQRRVEREPQPVAGERLVQRGMARGQRQARRVVEHLAALELLEPRAADEHRRHARRCSCRRPVQSRGAGARDDLQGQLAARLVEHLTVELHRAAALGALERVEDRLRALDLVGRRRERRR